MTTKHTLSLSKRFVFGVLGTALALVLVSSLLVFKASTEMVRTLDSLESNEQVASELTGLALRMEDLMHAARSWVHHDTPETLQILREKLAENQQWAPPSGVHQDSVLELKLNQIQQLLRDICRQIDGVVEISGMAEKPVIAGRWMEIEDRRPELQMHTLTGTLEKLVRHDFHVHANMGEKTAQVYAGVGLGLVILAVALGVLGAILLNRRLNQLESFITVCAWTKRVKYKDRWVSFEEFLEQRFQLKLSHGISEEAALMELERTHEEGAPD